MEKIAIAYVGNKPSKKDTVTGSRLLFPRLVPVDVESAIAVQLLEYPTVWRRADELGSVLARAEALKQVEQAEAEQAAAEAARQAEAQSMLVESLNLDLGKMTSAALATLAEKHQLTIDPKGSRESADDYRVRVRDALRALPVEQAEAEQGAE